MGADVHAYIDYEEDKDARNFCKVRIGRDYWLFILMAGVRGESIQGMKPVHKQKGLPKKISWQVQADAYLYITENAEGVEHACTKEDAERYAKYGKKYTEDKHYIEHPDWHSHTWLNLKELNQVINRYSNLKEKKLAYSKKGDPPPKGFSEKDLDKDENLFTISSDAYSKVEPLKVSPSILAIRGAMKELDATNKKPKLILWWDN